MPERETALFTYDSLHHVDLEPELCEAAFSDDGNFLLLYILGPKERKQMLEKQAVTDSAMIYESKS